MNKRSKTIIIAIACAIIVCIVVGIAFLGPSIIFFLVYDNG